MLMGPRMQSKFGSTEAVSLNGKLLCPLTTWDAKITTIQAMAGAHQARETPSSLLSSPWDCHSLLHRRAFS